MSDQPSQRDKRRQQFEAEKSKFEMTPAVKKGILKWGIIGLIAAAVTFGMVSNINNAGDCPGHWHSTFAVWVDDQQVASYGQYNLENERLPFAMHMHSGEQATTRYQVHWEPNPAECVGFGEFLDRVDTEVTASKLVLDGHHEGTPFAGTYTVEGADDLQIYSSTDGETWGSLSAKAMNKRQLQDGERLVILYGQYSQDRVDQILAGTQFPPAAPPPAQ